MGRTLRHATHALRAAALARAVCLGAAAATLAYPAIAQAQERPADASDQLRIAAERASSWTDGETRVVMVNGDVTIRTDEATLTAGRAVLWLTPTPGEGSGYRVQVSLLDGARVVRGDVTRAGGELFVTLATRPDVQLDVAGLDETDRRTDVHYLAAAQLRRQAERGEAERPLDISPTSPPPVVAAGQPAPTTARAARPPRQGTISFNSARADTPMTADGRVALVLNGDVRIIQQAPNGDRVELQAQSAVLFTRWTEPRQMISGKLSAQEDFDAVYLEDDVRVSVTSGDPLAPEQTLRASRAVYEFGTDRAILTDALLHTIEPGAAAPLVLRAREMRKLGAGVYEANGSSITTSDFKTPSLALSSSKVTVRQSETAGGRTRTSFVAENVTPRLYGVPFFYFPRLFGTVSDGELPIREVSLSQSGGFGFGIGTSWGLYQTLGREPPEGVDASYRVDYYSERGPALGLDATYAGGSINETTRQPFSFDGGFTAYATLDHGEDRLGRRRNRPQFDDEFRGRVRWNHQQFLSDGWQVQAQAAYVSDPTFLEEWFRNEFRNGLEQDTSLYVKRTSGNEVFGVLVSANLSDVATIADQLQEITPSDGNNFAPITVERLPQVEYHRLGESFGEDRFTWVSNNSAAGLRFNKTDENLLGADGYAFRNAPQTTVNDAFTGIPTYGYTGYTGDIVGRGDFRQEVAMPMGNDRLRITPYTVLRYTAWSDSPGGDAQQRLLGGVGVRTSTQFHKTYDGVQSKLFDLNRVRHIVEPQASLFASAQTQDRGDVYVYDEGVDGISDVVGAQLVVRQRFQTKRGGEGLFRSVDFLTLNTGVILFANQEDEIETPFANDDYTTAEAFRGVWYGITPEASIPRSTAFADSAWRVTDTTAILSDVAWNIDEQTLATTAVGVAVQRDPRVRYFAGVRYIGEINSTLATVTFDYDISERYSVALNQSFNLSEGQNQSTSAEITRRFEQLVFRVTVYFDQIEDEGGIQFSISPRNLPFGMNLQGRNTGRS